MGTTAYSKLVLGTISKVIESRGTTTYKIDWFDGLNEDYQYGDEQICRMKELLRDVGTIKDEQA